MGISLLLVGVGGSAGAVSRFAVTSLIKERINTAFPAATFLINAAGSFALGFLLPMLGGTPLWLLFGTGFLGGFTTFSTFSTEVIGLINDSKYKTAGIYLVLSCCICIAAALLGIITSTAMIS